MSSFFRLKLLKFAVPSLLILALLGWFLFQTDSASAASPPVVEPGAQSTAFTVASNSAPPFNINVSSASNRILFVSTFAEVASATNCSVSSVTANGVSLMNFQSIEIGSGANKLCESVWYLLTPPAVDTVINVQWLNTMPRGIAGGVVVSNAKQQAPTLVVVNSCDVPTICNGNGGSITTPITTVNNDTLVIDAAGGGEGYDLINGPSQQQIWMRIAGGTGTLAGGMSSITVSSPGTVTFQWSAPPANNHRRFTDIVMAIESSSIIPPPPPAFAGVLSGSAWSGVSGYLAFNCNDLAVEVPTICADAGDFKVSVATDGTISGQAWSEFFGWVSFDASDLASCPQAPCIAKLDHTTGKVSGWARACAGTEPSGVPLNYGDCTTPSRTDGWDGWISLRTQSSEGIDYGVYVEGCEWKGTAWGDQIVEWISFNEQTSELSYGVTGESGTASCVSTSIPTLEVEPDSNVMLPEGTQQYRAYYDEDGSGPIPRTEVTTDSNTDWDSSDPLIATVDNSGTKGLVTAEDEGSTSINATFDINSDGSYVLTDAANLTVGVVPESFSLDFNLLSFKSFAVTLGDDPTRYTNTSEVVLYATSVGGFVDPIKLSIEKIFLQNDETQVLTFGNSGVEDVLTTLGLNGFSPDDIIIDSDSNGIYDTVKVRLSVRNDIEPGRYIVRIKGLDDDCSNGCTLSDTVDISLRIAPAVVESEEF